MTTNPTKLPRYAEAHPRVSADAIRSCRNWCRIPRWPRRSGSPGCPIEQVIANGSGRLRQASGVWASGTTRSCSIRRRDATAGSSYLASTRSRTTSCTTGSRVWPTRGATTSSTASTSATSCASSGSRGTDFATVDLACAYARAVSVPLQTTLAGADLDGIFTDTAPDGGRGDRWPTWCWPPQLAGSHESIRSIIAFDYDERVDDDRDQYAAAQTELAQTRSRAQLITLDELIAFGDFQPWESLPAGAEGDERMAMLMHSSGSTGTPKGAIITERMAKASSGSPATCRSRSCGCAFAPMNHLAGRAQVYTDARPRRHGVLHRQARPVHAVRGHPAGPTDRVAVSSRACSR